MTPIDMDASTVESSDVVMEVTVSADEDASLVESTPVAMATFIEIEVSTP